MFKDHLKLQKCKLENDYKYHVILKLASSVKLGMWQMLVGPWRCPSQVDGSPFHFQTILLPVLGLRRPPLHHLVIQVMIILMMIVMSTWSPSTCTLPTPPALVTCQSCCCAILYKSRSSYRYFHRLPCVHPSFGSVSDFDDFGQISNYQQTL